MMIHACVISLAGMDPEPIYDEEIDRSHAVVCIDHDEEESEADVWQARLYDALVKKEKAKVVELLSVHNQVCKAPDITRFSDDDGRTFLMLAVGYCKSYKIVQMILRLIDPNLIDNYVARKDAHQCTALDYAAYYKCMRILYALAPCVDQKTRDTACNFFSQKPEERVHVNRRQRIFCLSELSNQNPSDDEDDTPVTPMQSPVSSGSSDETLRERHDLIDVVIESPLPFA